jgi:hypothetical protein
VDDVQGIGPVVQRERLVVADECDVQDGGQDAAFGSE